MMKLIKNNRFLFLFVLFIHVACKCNAQWTYGTTGLLNMPTADMQKEKTFMMGAGYLDKHTSTARWFYNTWNYYLNVTLFPWMEVSYNMVLHKAFEKDYGMHAGGYWVPWTYGKFVNQDRQFSVRFRIWKEGWVKSWTPQIVIGSDDISSHSWGDVSDRLAVEDLASNGFNNRYYIAASKHLDFNNIGNVGVHLSYLYNVRSDYPLNGVSLGVNYRPRLKDENSLLGRLVGGLNVMAEAYPADGRGYIYKNSDIPVIHMDRGVSVGKYDINVGLDYQVVLAKLRSTQAPALTLDFIGELYGCKDFSGGVQLKVHLK